MTECIFCDIVAGKEPAQILASNEDALAIAPLKETLIAQGHLLVLPKNHFKSIHDIPENELYAVMGLAKSIAVRLRERSEMKGINILHASGECAQQSVQHFHIHLLPRREGDGLDTWPETGYLEEAYDEVYEQLQNTLEESQD